VKPIRLAIGAVLVVAGLALLTLSDFQSLVPNASPTVPAPGPRAPNSRPRRPEPPRPRPRPRPCPNELTLAGEANAAVAVASIEKISVGGPVSPDGKVEVSTDLPLPLRTANVGGTDGAGLCVFTSIGHAARWQNERCLEDFQANMRKEAGGGYPEKVDRMIRKYGDGAQYLQYEGADTALLRQALAGGRMPSVTYNGQDPHYGGTVAHMVNLVAYTGDNDESDWACVLDNNFIGEEELVWLRPSEFRKRWTGGGEGWTVILLAPPPPLPPTN